MLSETPIDIGFREIITLEEKRFAARLAERIAEAVSVIEPRRMAALAICAKGVAGNLQLIDGKRDDLDRGGVQQEIQFSRTLLTQLGFDD